MEPLITPDEVEDVMYDGQMGFDMLKDDSTLISEPTRATIRPVVTVGRPEWWNLAQLAQEGGQPLGPELSLLLRRADFYLVRLACSFHPQGDSTIEKATFTAYMRPRSGDEFPIAFDLYPKYHFDEREYEFQVKVAPKLKFAEVLSGELGEAVVPIRFHRLRPVIVGSGIGQPDPAWEFEPAGTRPLWGCRMTYCIVKRPRGAQAVRISLDLSAEVKTPHTISGGIRGIILRAKIQEKDHAHLSTIICDD